MKRPGITLDNHLRFGITLDLNAIVLGELTIQLIRKAFLENRHITFIYLRLRFSDNDLRSLSQDEMNDYEILTEQIHSAKKFLLIEGSPALAVLLHADAQIFPESQDQQRFGTFTVAPVAPHPAEKKIHFFLRNEERSVVPDQRCLTLSTAATGEMIGLSLELPTNWDSFMDLSAWNLRISNLAEKFTEPEPLLTEFAWIQLIQQMEAAKPKDLQAFGIGDDCALLRLSGKNLILTSDTQWEDVHFRSDWSSPYQIGWKGVSAAYSDLAAKGVSSGYALVTAALPPGLSSRYAMEIWSGISEAADAYHLRILGGNTVFSKNKMNHLRKNYDPRAPLMLDLFLFGYAEEMPKRDQACSGDAIVITGWTGVALAGYQILRLFPEASADYPALRRQFLQPTIVRQQALFIESLITEKMIHVVMDISDGLISDLTHILRASGKAANLLPEKLPLHPELIACSSRFGWNATQLALQGGEDYIPLITMSPQYLEKAKTLAGDFSIPFYVIGYIENGVPGFISGVDELTNLNGYEHQ